MQCTCECRLPLMSLAENDSDKRILHKGSAHTGCVWLSQMLYHSGNFVDRVGYDDRYIGKDGKPTMVKSPIKSFRERVRALTTNEDGTLKSQYAMTTDSLLTRGAVLENDTVIINEFNVNGITSLVLAVVTQIKGKDCVGKILLKSEPYTISSPSAVIRNCDGSHDRTIVRIVDRLPMLGGMMVDHPTRGTCFIPDTQILPRAPSDKTSVSDTLSFRYRRQYHSPLKFRNMILDSDDVTWPISNCMRVAAYWTDHNNQRVHNVTIPEAVRIYMRTMEPLPLPPPQIPAQPTPYGGLCSLTPSLREGNNWMSDVDNEFTYKAGSNGSVKWKRGTFAWIAALSTGTMQGRAEIPSKHTSLHSFRTESGGILGVMSHLWDPNDTTRTVRLTTDNQTAADTYNGIYVENSSIDIWDEIRWWQSLWGERFVVVWKRGHPEKRNADATTWSQDDWRNHGADRLCETAYYTGLVINPAAYKHGRRWYWMHKNERVVENNMATYVDILKYESLVYLSNTSNIDYDFIDWEHTGQVIGHFTQTPLMKKARLVRMFDRNWFHGHMLACGLYGDVLDDVSNDRFSSNSTRWLHSNNLSWCQSCSADQLENREHYFAVCSNRKAKQIRGDWLAKLLKYTLTKLPHLNAHLQRHLVLHPEGHLTWKGSTDKASQILSGCIPRSWWSTLLEQTIESLPRIPSDKERATVDRMADNYRKFLNWLQRLLPTAIWGPFNILRGSHYEKRYTNANDDYDQQADERAIDEDENDTLTR